MSDQEKSDKEKESPAFKVTDRRKFDSSGNPREPDAEQEEEDSGSGPVKLDAKPGGPGKGAPEMGPQADPFSAAGGPPQGAPAQGRPAPGGPGGPSQAGGPGGAIPFPGAAAGESESPSGRSAPAGEGGPGESLGGRGRQEQEVDFSAFIMSMATGVLMALGEVPDPMTGRQGPVHLEQARHTIDILSMLREKTEGNLDAEEDRIVRQVLYELRMKYMEVVKKMGK
ncbi:MAG TPA: DUF1844 domain-containing protein [Acidobacteriota bacterium]|nr:DUF1844 domain-containing protein [Acidobacteriota bacterium]